jgi:hypothetical protein
MSVSVSVGGDSTSEAEGTLALEVGDRSDGPEEHAGRRHEVRGVGKTKG